MNGGVVQHGRTLRHPQKARALLERLGSQLGHLQKLLAGREGAVGLPVGHHVFGRGGGQARHPLQQGGRGRIHIHTHGVDAVLHHTVQSLTQPLGRAVMLVLSHTDGLGVDLHQLRQGVLEPPGNGYRRAQVYIKLRKFLRRQGTGGIDRGACLGDDHIADPVSLGRHPADQLHRHLLRLPAGGTVADGNVLHTVLFNEPGQGGNGLFPLPLSLCEVDHSGIQHLAGAVHHRHLAAHPVTRVQPHGDLALNRRLHQQGPQVQCELADGALAGRLRQGGAGLPLQRGEKQPVIGVLRRGLDKLHGRAARHYHLPADRPQGQFPVQLHADLERFLLFAPVDGQDLMPLKPGDGLGEIIVEPVDRILLRGGGAGQSSVLFQQRPQTGTQGGVVADLLGHNVRRPGQSLLGRLYPLVRVYVLCRLCQRVRTVRSLGKEHLGQRRQPLLPGNRRPGAALLLIGPVQVLHLRQCGGFVNGAGKLLREFSLGLNGGFHSLPPLLQAPQIAQALFQGPQGRIIHGTVKLLTVAGNEGNRISLVQQPHHIFHILRFLIQFLCNTLYDRVHRVPFRCAPGRRPTTKVCISLYHSFPPR